MDCPSTPAAPLLAFTCLYASHTSRLAIQNGFALSMAVIPLRVATGIAPNDDAPSVRFHYRTINPTTGASAPVPRIGTRTLAATDRFLCSLPKPVLRSRRLHAGRRLGSQQASPNP